MNHLCIDHIQINYIQTNYMKARLSSNPLKFYFALTLKTEIWNVILKLISIAIGIKLKNTKQCLC